VLSLVTELARELAGADLVTLALPDEDRRRLVIEYAIGEHAESSRGLVLPAERSLSGLVLASGGLIATPDFSHDKRVATMAREALGLGPAIIVPLGAPGNVRGVLTAGRAPGGQPFAPAAADMVATFAAQAAVALELAEHRREAERLSVFEDRDRIARDLHDLVIQRLYATGMSLEGATPLITRPEVATRVRTAVDAMDETIKDIRATIFALQAHGTAKPPGTRARILAVADEMTGPLGYAPSLRLAGPLDDLVTGDLVEQLLNALRESLSNAARHAKAGRVDVTIETSSDAARDGTRHELALIVRDDGVGIPEGVHRSGLRNLADRAEQLGGTMRVGPWAASGAGTQLEWRVPLP
jgi:signal transduction histidine kinase